MINELIITFTKSNVYFNLLQNKRSILVKSIGSYGFKNAEKRRDFCIESTITQFVDSLNPTLHNNLIIKFYGYKRNYISNVIEALDKREFKILRIKDTTSLAHNGCRLPKKRR